MNWTIAIVMAMLALLIGVLVLLVVRLKAENSDLELKLSHFEQLYLEESKRNFEKLHGL